MSCAEYFKYLHILMYSSIDSYLHYSMIINYYTSNNICDKISAFYHSKTFVYLSCKYYGFGKHIIFRFNIISKIFNYLFNVLKLKYYNNICTHILIIVRYELFYFYYISYKIVTIIKHA